MSESRDPRELGELPQPIREIENVFIEMADGVALAARIWMPVRATTNPVPAILEYIPYRKRDFMRLRDEPMHRYYAGHGYAAVRVDVRGSGDSGGVLEDEYLPLEQHDAVQVIEWIARQPWCDGRVGMTGISWGGFNALQVAALAPPALEAVITLCASDDRYADDAHYMGGCVLNENQIWGTVLFALNALPPDPEIVGESWRDMWRERLQANRPFPAVWLQHQHRDGYWKQGSVCEDFSRIRCPVYAIGGWADGYTNAVFRLLEGLPCVTRALVGPWAHNFPHNGVPGPAIGYLSEALRWWDRWLKGDRNGIEHEPALRAWMQDGVPPEPALSERPGRWIAEQRWPRVDPTVRRFHLGAPAALGDAPGPPAALELRCPQATGLTAGVWCEFGSNGEAPRDQRPDDGRSLVFDSAPLSRDLEFLGAPMVVLALRVDRPCAMIAVRLNEVFPDGASSRITYGLLNLTHRESHEHPRALEPGKLERVHISLNHIAHRALAGNVVRLAVSTACWPLAWPSPEAVTLTLETTGSHVELPVRERSPLDDALPAFGPAESAAATSTLSALHPARFERRLERDLVSNDVRYRVLSEGGDLEQGAVARIDAVGLTLGHTVEREFDVNESDPLAARTRIRERYSLQRGAWRVVVEAETVTSCSRDEFRVQASLDASENGASVVQRTFDRRIPRDLV